SLSYNSQGGPGLAGYGWNVSGISKITRIPKTKFHDEKIKSVDLRDDRFALDGQRLLVKNGTGGIYGANGTQYETENFSNIKITSYGGNPNFVNTGPSYFLVEYPDGSKAYYGSQNATSSPLEWPIVSWENAQGVNIKYEYSFSSSGFNGWGNISSIKYGTRSTTTPINEIKFVYENRTRKETAYIGTLEYEQYYRLKEIQSISNNIGFRNYLLEYTQTTQNYDQLSKVTEKNGDKSKSYNPTVFQYNNTESAIKYIPNPNQLNIGSVSSLNAATVSGDFDGDGNMDFLLYPTIGTEARKKYWLFTGVSPNTGAQTFPNYGIEIKPGLFDEIFPVSFLTLDTKYWLSQGWTVLKTNPTTNLSTFTTHATTGSPFVYPQDEKQYTFPKFTRKYLYPCSGAEPQSIAQTSRLANSDLNATASTSKEGYVEANIPKSFLSGDFNGDGLTDIVVIEKTFNYFIYTNCTATSSQTYTGGKSYFVNLDRRVTANFVNQAGILPINPNSKCYVADFNGDGKSDIFIFDTGVLKIYSLDQNNTLVLISQTINSSIRLDIPIVIGDFNGDGNSDFITPGPGTANWWYRFPSKGIADEKGNGYTIEDLPNYAPFTANNSSNSYNYLATDYDNDGKSDLTIVKNTVKIYTDASDPLKATRKGTIQVSTIT
ncbi:MAG TPA: VCBS repeat-containing protein, partial [Flavobacterium sp.]|uniref:FG-GAP repeat domain-containing protein n=1 Tax=Flavobacterium sp. TaxID=239 RepID=UPI002ED340DF